jgi:hypothetical protein
VCIRDHLSRQLRLRELAFGADPVAGLDDGHGAAHRSEVSRAKLTGAARHRVHTYTGRTSGEADPGGEKSEEDTP